MLWALKWKQPCCNVFELPHDKTNKMACAPMKTQISLGICPVWSESSLCTQWIAKDPRCRHANSEDSDQTGQMLRLIWAFAGRTGHFLGFVMRRLIWSLVYSYCNILHEICFILSIVFFIFLWGFTAHHNCFTNFESNQSSRCDKNGISPRPSLKNCLFAVPLPCIFLLGR